MQPLPPITKGVYRHYKGGLYDVLDVARHSESQEFMVVYRPLYGERECWVRPYAMFMEQVVVDGLRQPRFAPAPTTPVVKVEPEKVEVVDKPRMSEADIEAKMKAILETPDQKPDFSSVPVFENPRHIWVTALIAGVVILFLLYLFSR